MWWRWVGTGSVVGDLVHGIMVGYRLRRRLGVGIAGWLVVAVRGVV